MITKEQLRDWLDKKAREKRYEEIESYIDKVAKEEILKGKTSFCVSTGRVGHYTHHKTPFYALWRSEDLSKESAHMVRSKILSAYRENGFDVSPTRVDCGWDSSYEALYFKDVHKVLEVE